MSRDRPQRVSGGAGVASAEPPHEYTGEIRRADADGAAIVGFLVDKLGTRIELRGHKDARRGHGYFLYGVVRLPAHLQLPGEDA